MNTLLKQSASFVCYLFPFFTCKRPIPLHNSLANTFCCSGVSFNPPPEWLLPCTLPPTPQGPHLVPHLPRSLVEPQDQTSPVASRHSCLSRLRYLLRSLAFPSSLAASFFSPHPALIILCLALLTFTTTYTRKQLNLLGPAVLHSQLPKAG